MFSQLKAVFTTLTSGMSRTTTSSPGGAADDHVRSGSSGRFGAELGKHCASKQNF